MADTEDLVVEVPADLDATPAPEKVGEESNKAVSKADSMLAKQVEAMKAREKEIETARANAEANARAEREARERVQAENQRLAKQAEESNVISIKSAIEAKTAEVAKAEDEYAAAMESGNFREAAKIQTRLSKAAATLARLENVEARGPAPAEGQVRAPVRQEPAGDPIDRHIDAMNTGDRAKAWLRQHKECLTDTRKYNLMIGAHQEAIDKGYSEGGDNYFAHLEQKLGYRDENGEGDDGSVVVDMTAKREQPQKRVLAAAPVSRESTSLNGARSGQTQKVILSAAEKEAADFSGVSYAEYARQKLIAIKNGDFDDVRNQ